MRALWFDLTLLGEEEARRRVLAHWQAGARLFLMHEGYLLEWAQACWHQVEALDGLALCEVGHVLSSAPLTQAELAQLDAGAYWLVRGAHALAATPDARCDPAAWLDLRAIALREPLAFPRGVVDPALVLPEAPMHLRDILGGAIPAPSAEREAFLRQSSQAVGEGGTSARKGAAGIAGAVGLGVLGLLASWASRFLPASATASAGGGDQSASGSGSARQTQRPAGLTSWARRLADLTVRLAMFTRISTLLGWRQAQYMRKMLDMFEDGDLQEALRHAIPIDAVNQGQPRQALGTPRARSQLTVTGPSAVAATLDFGNEMQQHLRAIYRRTFERLDREGKIDEAVYVLAELLQCGAEAVTYLETKERFQQAAQLAETVELAAEIRTRLWLLAGDTTRAIRLARLHNSFADVVRQLESKQSVHAASLRRQWAEHLAARGDLAEAIDVIWPLPEHHALALACLVQAQRAGGTLGMRALARKLALLPNMLSASASAIGAVLAAGGDDGAQQRARLAKELLVVKPQSAATRRVAAALARQVIAERMEGLNQLDRTDLSGLVELGDSALLRADLPTLRLPAAPPQDMLAKRSSVLHLTLNERGLLAIHDVRYLPDGHYLLALGEGGLLRVNRLGKQVAHYPVPAYHLVMAASGQRALALARRDQTYRISRIDLITGKVADWLCLPLRYWSEHYDGVTWNVALDARIAAIDTTAAQLTISWQVADLPGEIVAYADDGNFQVVLLKVGYTVEQWSYAQPGRQLRQRESWEHSEVGNDALMPSTALGAPYCVTVAREASGARLHIGRLGAGVDVDLALGALEDCRVFQRYNWLFIVAVEGDQMRCLVLNRSGQTKAIVTMEQADNVRVCVQGDHILVFDRAGRLLDIDSLSGQVQTHSLS